MDREAQRSRPPEAEPGAPPEEAPAIQVSGAPVRCPLCHGDLLTEEALTACRVCSARHHADCWANHSRCASCGHGEALVERDAPETSEGAATTWTAVYALASIACLVLAGVTLLLPTLVVPGHLRAHVVPEEWRALMLATSALTLAWSGLAGWCARAAWRSRDSS
jgi:hypothetical protein